MLALSGILVFPVCAGMAVAARELVLVVLGRQWSVAATAVPWFALAAGCSVMSALSQTVAEARADLYRSLGVQGAYIVVLAAFLAVAVAHRSHGIWVFAAAVAAAEVLRHVGYLGLMRRVVGLTMTQVWASYAPAAFASAGVALAMAVIRRALATEAPHPGDVRRRGGGWRVGAPAVHPVLPAAGDPPRTAHAADRGRGARRRRRPALAPGTARSWPAGSSIMIELVLLGLGLAAVGAVGIAVTEVLVRRAEVGAALLLGATLISATLVGRVPSLTLPGGIRVQLLDVAFALVLAAAILRVLRLPRFTPWQRWALLVGIMLLLSLVRGAVAFGPQHAIAEFRLFLAFVAGALYFCTFPPSSRLNDRIGRIWLALSIPMMILVCLRWLANFAGINLGVPPEQFGADAAIRVLNGPYTFFLADAVILTVPFWQLHDRRSRRLTWLGALLLLFVVLLNRRTAWLAIVVGLAVIMVRGRRLNRRVVAMVVGAVLLTIAAYVALGGSEGQKQTVATSAVSTGTLDWRIQGWSELLAGRSEDPVQWVIGEPLGSDFTREVQGSEVQAEPHNFYLTLLLRAGVVGLLALVALDWWVVPRVMAAPAAKRPGRPARARRVPGVAGDADRLVLRVDPRDGAGNHHRSRGGPGRLQPWRCPVSPGAPGGPRLRRRACTGTRCTNRQGAATVGDLNMSVRHAARRAVQRVGLDVQPFPRSAPLFQVVRLMNRRGVTCVIDVGANIGQYASELRRLRLPQLDPFA